MLALVCPLPRLPDGREPLMTHEFEPHTHLGNDWMYRWREGDATKPPECYIAAHGPENARVPTYSVPLSRWQIPVLAMADGKVVYAKLARNGWRTRIRSEQLGVWYGQDWCDYLDFHMSKLFVADGDTVKAGQPIGICGGDPTDKPTCTVHDHHEHRRQAHHDEDHDGYGTVAIDPYPVLSKAVFVDIPGGMK